jgi:hypothetical protein
MRLFGSMLEPGPPGIAFVAGVATARAGGAQMDRRQLMVTLGGAAVAVPFFTELAPAQPSADPVLDHIERELANAARRAEKAGGSGEALRITAANLRLFSARLRDGDRALVRQLSRRIAAVGRDAALTVVPEVPEAVRARLRAHGAEAVIDIWRNSLATRTFAEREQVLGRIRAVGFSGVIAEVAAAADAWSAHADAARGNVFRVQLSEGCRQLEAQLFYLEVTAAFGVHRSVVRGGYDCAGVLRAARCLQ